MAQHTKVYAHRDQWTEPFTPTATRAVWNAHRPLQGDFHWQGRSRWGVWYASADVNHPDFARWAANNVAMDAREVEVVTNLRVLELAQERAAAAGGGYGLDVYVGELGHEGAKEFAHRWELPWSATDLTGDVLIARMSGGAA